MAIIAQKNSYLKEGIVYSLFFFILFLLQTKTINTGDAGELVSAAFGLGIAHPSGYPVYLQIAKFLTFLPFGNIPMKVALLSSLSATLLFYFGSLFLKKNGASLISIVFFGLILLSCYSFFNESVVAKFYPLNTLLIFAIFIVGYMALDDFHIKYQLISSFLFGIALGLHHTTFLMVTPLIVPIIFNFKRFIKLLPLSILFFALGAVNVIYLYIRSLKPVLLNMAPSPNIQALIATLERKAYGNSASINVVESLFKPHFDRIFFALKNSIILIGREFHPYIFFFLIIGFMAILINNKKKFLYFLLTFVAYSFVLAYLTFSQKNPDLNAWYIAANQYYVPLLFFAGLISAFGFSYLISKLTLKISSVKYLFLIIPVIYLPQNYFLNNFDSNYVAYYKTIDQFFSKPVKSVVIYSGDNDVFQGWYLKNIERFRDDLCLISAPVIKNKIWETQNGCNAAIYRKYLPEITNRKTVFNMASLKKYMLHKRVYSSSPIEQNKFLSNYLKSLYTIYDFMVIPKTVKNIEPYNNWAEKIRKKFLPFSHYKSCLYQQTDDLFTKALCDKYVTYLSFIARDLGNKGNAKNKSKIDVWWGKDKKTLIFFANEKNISYLMIAKKIHDLDNLTDYYLFSGF